MMPKKSNTKKDDVFIQAKEDFGVQLDRRLTLAQLEEQMQQLARNKANPQPAQKELVPKRVKNVITGNEFEYNPIFKNNPDLQIIEWETENGDN
jgi:hypothetical protein|tara:strand:- start:139 stop:420 length:282 start_codon:yes stop_codon:yes gene_type:complete